MEVGYDQSVKDRSAARPDISATNAGLFRNGTSSGTMGYADFAQSIEGFNSYAQAGSTGSYTVRAGDTLAGIAAQLWGDANLWYRLAEANGLSAQAGLIEGSSLILPPIVKALSRRCQSPHPLPQARIGSSAPGGGKSLLAIFNRALNSCARTSGGADSCRLATRSFRRRSRRRAFLARQRMAALSWSTC